MARRTKLYNEAQHLDARTRTPEEIEQERVRQFMALAHARFKLASEAESRNRKDSLDDLEFLIGEQWPSEIQNQRTQDGRPCLTMNRLPQFVRQVTNEQRQQRPAVQVNPAGDGSSVETAAIFEGMIRHIEVNSDAEIAYDSAFESCVTSGLGYFRIVTEYNDDDSFDQEIKVKRIKNPFTVYFDPAAVEPCYEDAEFCFIVQDMSLPAYRAEYPNSSLAGLTEFQSTGDQSPDWVTKETIRVAEYFRIERESITVCRLQDGSLCRLDAVPPGAVITQRRERVQRRVVWTKINAIEILAENEWAGRYIPLIPVIADDKDVNGQRHVAGLVRAAKDPMRMYNYWCSAATEQIALASKAPWIGAAGQFRGREAMWAASNNKNFAYLEYEPTDIGGKPVAAPQRNVAEPPIQAISLMIRQADNDLKATTGIYDASLGQSGAESSGKAILARQKQSDIGTLNFVDNLTRSIRYAGRQMVDLIPKIYDAPRVQRIIKPDQTVDHVGVFNSQAPGNQGIDPAALAAMQQVKKIYDLGAGKYDVTVSVGPSYQSKRQESVASMLTLVNAYPQVLQIAGDLLVRNMDWPGANEIADRLKKMLPPQLQDNDVQGDPKAQLQKMQTQMQAMMQQHDLLTKALDDATQTIREKKLDIESKERIAMITAQVQLLTVEAKVRGEAALSALQAKLDAITNRLSMINENTPIGEEAAAPAQSSNQA